MSDDPNDDPSQDQLKDPAIESWWFECNFSPDELFILRSSFESVKNRLEMVAVTAFITLFDRRPDAFRVFIGRKVLPSSRSDVAYSFETRQHGLRVLSAFEKILNRIDYRWQMVKELITTLAVHHLKYGAKPVYVLALFGCLREALLKEMEETRRENIAGLNLAINPSPLSPWHDKFRLSHGAINMAWNKFFRTIGLALVAEMLSLEETMPAPLNRKTSPASHDVVGKRNSSGAPKSPNTIVESGNGLKRE